MRVPRDSGFEPQVVASINRYRHRALALRLAVAAVLMAGVIAALAAYLSVPSKGGSSSAPEAQHWVALALIAFMLALLVLFIRPEKIPVVPPPYRVSPAVFRNALDGVSLALGLDPPRLMVLDIPTVNSISLFHAGRPAVGVTVEALDAGLSRSTVEAMMAHELSHVLLGDVVAGSNTRRWRLVGLSLVGAVVLPFVLLALAFGFGAWTWLGLFGWTAFTIILIMASGRLTNRQDNLLADSLAAKITGDPGALKEAVILLDGMFLKNERPFPAGARYPMLLFVHEARPEVELAAPGELLKDEDDTPEWRRARDRNLLKGLRRESAFPRESIARRIENLEAIERGNWPAFGR